MHRYTLHIEVSANAPIPMRPTDLIGFDRLFVMGDNDTADLITAASELAKQLPSALSVAIYDHHDTRVLPGGRETPRCIYRCEGLRIYRIELKGL